MKRPHPVRKAMVALILTLAWGPAHAADDGAAIRQVGPYTLHYNAMAADELDPDLARRHDLPRSHDQCIVTIAVMRGNGGTVSAMVMGEATRPDGRMHALDLREIRDGGDIYYVASFPRDGAKRLEFTIKVSPGGDRPPEMIHFSRRFDGG